ncbi:HAMP domain-containing histidine kinase [Chloroflexia bacterium SDU3-3]|nr:HAMP domain-containing histidine kinase [Chloroflexia bacterium SDU3-3]
MLNGLRWRLTALYACAALALLLLLGGGAYSMLASYFQRMTDTALQIKLVQQLQVINQIHGGAAGEEHGEGAVISAASAMQIATAAAGREAREAKLIRIHGAAVYEVAFEKGGSLLVDATSGELRGGRGKESERHEEDDDGSYETELAAIGVILLDAQGHVLDDQGRPTSTISPNSAALAQALASGSDLRTGSADGTPTRLLTHRVGLGDVAAIQLARPLGDQQRTLGQLMLTLVGLGGISVVLVAFSSWWLAGSAIRPAQIAWDRQQHFIASASHELRTPLTLIRASAEVAQRASASNDQREILGDLLAECDHMGGLVDDLLTLSRLDSGNMRMQPELVALGPLIEDVARQMGRLAEERGVRLLAEPSAAQAWADPTRLRQVLLILLDNALRYTPQGGSIAIGATEQGRRTLIQVRDTGAGIAPEHLPRVFERFYRADSARGAGSGNVGLGLSIAQGLARAHGGELMIESELGVGTQVTLVLKKDISANKIAVSHR